MDSLQGRFWPGPDDPVISEMDSQNYASAWLADAIKAFFDAFGVQALGEVDGQGRQVRIDAQSLNLPKWAMSYLDHLPQRGHKARVVRAAAWFYLGQLSAQDGHADLLRKIEEIVIRAGAGGAPVVMSKQDEQLIDDFTSQF